MGDMISALCNFDASGKCHWDSAAGTVCLSHRSPPSIFNIVQLVDQTFSARETV